MTLTLVGPGLLLVWRHTASLMLVSPSRTHCIVKAPTIGMQDELNTAQGMGAEMHGLLATSAHLIVPMLPRKNGATEQLSE